MNYLSKNYIKLYPYPYPDGLSCFIISFGSFFVILNWHQRSFTHMSLKRWRKPKSLFQNPQVVQGRNCLCSLVDAVQVQFGTEWDPLEKERFSHFIETLLLLFQRNPPARTWLAATRSGFKLKGVAPNVVTWGHTSTTGKIILNSSIPKAEA